MDEGSRDTCSKDHGAERGGADSRCGNNHGSGLEGCPRHCSPVRGGIFADVFGRAPRIKRKRGGRVIKVVFKNGCICKWKKKEYTDYKYDGKCFIVIRGQQWVGIYNMDSIVSIIIK